MMGLLLTSQVWGLHQQSCLCLTYVLRIPCITAELASTSGRVQADAYVFAAGLGIPALAKKAGFQVLLSSKPATLNVYTVPAPPLLQHMLLSGQIFCCPDERADFILRPSNILAPDVLRLLSCINGAPIIGPAMFTQSRPNCTSWQEQEGDICSAEPL